MNYKKKINLMHLVLSLETGGMERFIYEHCLAVDKEKFNVSVCCIDRLGGFYQKLIDEKIDVSLFQKNQNHFDFLFAFRLSKLLKKNKVDVLHTHPGSFYHGSLGGFIARVPVVLYTEHGRHLIEPKFLKYFDKISTFLSDLIVTVSPELKTYLIEQIKLPGNKITTVLNGVNTNTFFSRPKSQKLLQEFSISAKCKVVGTVGRLAEVKDHKTTIDAFRRLHLIIPDSKLIIVGDGEYLNELNDYVDSSKLKDSVVFCGNREDIQEILSILDVFVMSSLSEGTSFSLLESMAAEIPSVVTNVGGNKSIIKNGYNGFLVNIKDSDNICEKLLCLLRNNNLANKIGKNAREYVLNNYSLKKNIENYEKIYLDLYEKNIGQRRKNES
ncbi:glycosyltransferase [Desulfuromonas sp. KJ2020]|uniref:glycosyltransferase n=1 Tax=Desulfuromonas sp. KJ2020 TaxID=2919173 RepID=UPI0020A81E7F|nr:glycosyltransferase [Desulfuromonas sp. KJ2020]MCP3178132.1 glycosyltransferase [Desulfuromonas sp. KJ2020]